MYGGGPPERSVVQYDARELGEVAGEVRLVDRAVGAEVAEPVDVAVGSGLAACDGAEVDALDQPTHRGGARVARVEVDRAFLGLAGETAAAGELDVQGCPLSWCG